MSQLDAYFSAVATRGLPVYPEPVPGESTLEPGYLYTYEGADVSAIFALPLRAVHELAGKRIALKCISEMEDPGELHMVTPAGQRIEGDNGMLADFAQCGLQQDGAYREWVCDPDGNWLLVSRVGLMTNQIVIQGIPIEVQGEPLVNT